MSISEVRESIGESFDLITKWTGRPQLHFSYPYGDYSSKVLSVLKEFGVKTAVTADDGRWTLTTESLKIPRVDISGYDGIAAFKAKLSGAVSRLVKIRGVFY